MATIQHVALLRGINVGGRNALPMADLRSLLTENGYEDVRTYIQSGNVLFRSAGKGRSLEDDLARVIEQRFGFPVPVVVRSQSQLAEIVSGAPAGFGESAEHLCDVIFLKDELTPAQALAALELREGVDEAWAGTGVVYFSRVDALRTKSRMSRITAKPQYQSMTIRNWRTTTKLLDLMAEG
jgi:uncharacterized protein (DUF1697 family)